jgi:hypothetical protein
MGVFGAQFEIRILGYIGVELDLLYADESGSSEISVTDLNTNVQQVFTINVGHSAFHMPLLLKAAIPSKTATPIFFLGPEFVIPSDDADFSIDGTNGTDTAYGAYTESYSMFAFGLGVEFNLPTAGVDMRIPLTIRGAYNPGFGSREEITRHEPAAPRPGCTSWNAIHADAQTCGLTREEYATTWEWNVRAQIGTTVNF